ncbi:helix-turn-helix domain-containing protein [Paenibacillus barengoltzii]|jgi:transcriptional regulator with XRE-family HTH domain|uniref:helix-turn-helix domain-containing protein n=1 Tax=Paenibacillus barengoltzii TaxID=343517 RepID=UPI002FD9B60D
MKNMDFADKLQNYRRQKGMSQEKLAEAIGVSRQAVSKWESGQSYPETDKLIALCELFEVSMDHLVRGVPTEKRELPPESNGSAMFRYRYHYEYKSERTWFGLPLLHINVGRGMYVAKGIIAIGNISIGAVSLGLIALGGLSLGVLAAGVISLAAIALALILALGGFAAGFIAAGGAAVGVLAFGGFAVGVYSFGGLAIASRIAVGGYASGHIAIGDAVRGTYSMAIPDGELTHVQAEQVRALINQEYPKMWKPLTEWIVSLFH